MSVCECLFDRSREWWQAALLWEVHWAVDWSAVTAADSTLLQHCPWWLPRHRQVAPLGSLSPAGWCWQWRWQRPAVSAAAWCAVVLRNVWDQRRDGRGANWQRNDRDSLRRDHLATGDIVSMQWHSLGRDHLSTGDVHYDEITCLQVTFITTRSPVYRWYWLQQDHLSTGDIHYDDVTCLQVTLITMRSPVYRWHSLQWDHLSTGDIHYDDITCLQVTLSQHNATAMCSIPRYWSLRASEQGEEWVDAWRKHRAWRSEVQWMVVAGWDQCSECPAVLWHCWLDDRKVIQPACTNLLQLFLQWGTQFSMSLHRICPWLEMVRGNSLSVIEHFWTESDNVS